MLIPTIEFDITDFSTGNSEHFVVENTEYNYELIAGHRFTRNIQFVKKFDFQFTNEYVAPQFMVETLVIEYLDSVQIENEIDETDEMVGMVF